MRDTSVATADPVVPIMGRPKWPYTRAQAATALMTFAVTSATVMGATMPSAWR